MKQILLAMLICGSVLSASAQTTTVTHKYYYYPSANIYFDEPTGNYWYWDIGSSKWVMTQTLPSTITVTETTERYPINYKGNDPWKNNNADKMKYKAKKGKIKTKPKS